MFNKYNNCSWVDFPKDRLQDILYYYDSKLEPVCRSILNYHKVPKSDWQTLDKRMQFLQDISNLAKNINQNIYHNTYYNKVLVKINEIALSKLNYLRAIKILNHKVEKMYLKSVLSKTNGNVSEASKLAGIGRATFYKKLGIEEKEKTIK